jgi:hypothetical protein
MSILACSSRLAMRDRGQQEDEVIEYSSRQVYCSTRKEPAVISVVERARARGTVRFVLWCSLRGDGSCDEQCLCVAPSDA